MPGTPDVYVSARVKSTVYQAVKPTLVHSSPILIFLLATEGRLNSKWVFDVRKQFDVGAFERRRYMNVVVQKARHPQLREYIHSAVNGLLPFIQKGMVERVAVIFFNNENVPVERFIFKLNVNQSFGSTVEEADLEFSLRSFLVKLTVSEAITKALPMDCRWEITAYFRSLPQASTSKDVVLWIPTDTKLWQQPPLITPIKSMSSEHLSLQLYLEHPSPSEPNI